MIAKMFLWDAKEIEAIILLEKYYEKKKIRKK